MKLFRIIFITFAIILTACTSVVTADSGHPAVEKSEPQIVSMKKFKFIPETLEIKAGQTVRWVNNEKRQYHTVFFEKQGEKESDWLFPDDFYEKKFDTPGEYEYRCGPHPKMIGKIIVK